MDAKQKISLKKRIESHIISKDDCWTTNYYISLSRGGKQQNITIDGKSCKLKRVVYEVYKEEDPKSLWVYNKCDNSLCINPEHLFLGTKIENGPNQKRRNKQVKGSKTKGASKSKLTENKVMEIKKLLFEQEFTIAEIAKLFGVSPSTIGGISRGVTWMHVIYAGV